MNALRMKKSCSLTSGKHSWQRLGDSSWQSSLPRVRTIWPSLWQIGRYSCSVWTIAACGSASRVTLMMS